MAGNADLYIPAHSQLALTAGAIAVICIAVCGLRITYANMNVAYLHRTSGGDLDKQDSEPAAAALCTAVQLGLLVATGQRLSQSHLV